MSADTVDDLHAAEDLALQLGAALEAVLQVDPEDERWWADTAFVQARAALASWQGYCRPCCQADGVHADCQEGDPDTCGCPCGHAEADR